MPLFRRQDDLSSLPPPPSAGDTLMGEVRKLLDHIGVSRLKVHDPRVKVQLTQIAQNGERRVMPDPTQQPSDMVLIEFRSHLESLVRVIAQYREFQDHPTRHANAEEMMSKAHEAIVGFLRYVMEVEVPGGSRNLTNFKVDTDILAAKQYR